MSSQTWLSLPHVGSLYYQGSSQGVISMWVMYNNIYSNVLPTGPFSYTIAHYSARTVSIPHYLWPHLQYYSVVYVTTTILPVFSGSPPAKAYSSVHDKSDLSLLMTNWGFPSSLGLQSLLSLHHSRWSLKAPTHHIWRPLSPFILQWSHQLLLVSSPL